MCAIHGFLRVDLCLKFLFDCSAKCVFFKHLRIYQCVKSVQMQSFFWYVFSRIGTKYREILPNAGKYESEKSPYLDTFTQCIYNVYVYILYYILRVESLPAQLRSNEDL